MSSKIDGYKPKLTGSELHGLHHIHNERRSNSTHVKVPADALFHLLCDYAELITLNRNSYNHTALDDK